MDDLANQERHKRINLTDREARLINKGLRSRALDRRGYNVPGYGLTRGDGWGSDRHVGRGGRGGLWWTKPMTMPCTLVPMMEQAEAAPQLRPVTKAQTALADAGYFAGPPHLDLRRMCQSWGQQATCAIIVETFRHARVCLRSRFLKDLRITRTDSPMTSRATALRAHRGRRSRSSDGHTWSMRTESLLRLYRASGSAVCQACPAFRAPCTRAKEIGRAQSGHRAARCGEGAQRHRACRWLHRVSSSERTGVQA